MKISVIIPTYRPRSYLWECLESLKMQTFPKDDFEIILVLNGCNEPYHSQIEGYLSLNMSDNIVNFIHLNQGGVSNARNVALNCARGEYIAFVDDDDFISPSYLEELYAKAAPDTISLCYPYAFKDGENNIQLEYEITNAYDKCNHLQNPTLSSVVRKFFSGPCMKLIPKDFISDRRFDVNFENGEDSLFMFLISDRINKLSFTSDKAIYYRRFRKNSATTRPRGRMLVIGTEFRRIYEYTRIYLTSPMSYSLKFYITRLLGSMRSIMQ